MRRIISAALFIIIQQFGFGQSFDVEKEKIVSASELEIKAFNSGVDKKGYRAIYYFTENGKAFKSEHFFKRKLLSVHEYYYNEYGLLTRNVETFSVNEKNRNNTTHYRYELNEQGQILMKASVFGPGLFFTNYYMNYNAMGKPEKIKTENSTQEEVTQVLTYDSLGRAIQFASLVNDSLVVREIREYNIDGELVYSDH